MKVLTVNNADGIKVTGIFADVETAAAKSGDSDLCIITVEDLQQFTKAELSALLTQYSVEISATAKKEELCQSLFDTLQAQELTAAKTKKARAKKEETEEQKATREAKEAKKAEREQKKLDKANAPKKDRSRSLKDQLRDLFNAGRILTAADIKTEIYDPASYEVTPFTIGTAINNLKSERNCGKEGRLEIVSGIVSGERVYHLASVTVKYDAKEEKPKAERKSTKKAAKELLDKINSEDEERDNSEEQLQPDI